MKQIPSLPPSHDLVRLFRPTQDETTQALLDHLIRRPGGFSYQLARSLSPFAFAGDVPLSALKRACDVARIPSGRASNWEVVQLIREAGVGRVTQCYAMSDGRLHVRRDLSIRVAADFYFVESGKVHVFWLQPRRQYALNNSQLGMFGALLRLTLLTGDFADAEIELLDLSAQQRSVRNSRTLRLSDLPSVSDDEVETAIQRVVQAYDDISAMGIDWEKIRHRPATPASSNNQGDLPLG